MDKFANEISRHVWQTKYRCADHATRERSIADTWRRVARALAVVEPKDSETWESFF
jgi:ribonucleoside-diphosphate reductase alpha chain